MITEISRPKHIDKESQAAFFWDWLGGTGERVLESHKWSQADKENVDTIFDKLEQSYHPSSNQTLYKNKFL